MNINYFSIESASALNLESSLNSPICIFRGRHSDLVLDLMRELIGDYGAQNDPDRIDDGHFVIHADIEIDKKNYSACYIRNADFMGDNRIAVNFVPNSAFFSSDDTNEFIEKCSARDINTANVLIKTTDIAPMADDRPIFIYEYLDRIDVSIDITPVLDRLASHGRQIFVAVCAGYPAIKNEKVQVIDV